MEHTTRPSKQFIIRGSIAIGVVVVVLTLQTSWVRGLFHKKATSTEAPAQTVGDLLTKDSNGNGVPDWEEKLWGLDPTSLYTNGVPNKQIIEEKKKALGVTDQTNSEPENETDALARELFTVATALGESGDVSDTTLQAVAKKLVQSVTLGDFGKQYLLSDLHTVPTTTASLSAYYKTVQKAVASYTASTPDIEVVVNALQTGDLSQVPTLANTKTVYETFSKNLSTISVPIGIEQYHLDLVNGLSGMAVSFKYLADLADNGVNAVVGMALYRIYDDQISAATSALHDYFVRYGIISS
ncbi:MAG TPA: hypothetical protein VG982_02030 [Candidatus Paceibacterota bacterium]|jgi:hypothetical protein|nr:hypothetical protein [Candidatus Paceibacterota bacterium]